MEEKDNKGTELVYYRVVDLWRRFAQEHTVLLEYTFDEYACLLSSDIEALEKKITQKGEVIERINTLEELREKLIREVGDTLPVNEGTKVSNVPSLLKAMLKFEKDGSTIDHLSKYNELLIDIIEKIQEQNKKNQMFINKAIFSLNEMTGQGVGKVTYSTYGSKGELSR